MWAIADDLVYACPEPLLLIVGGSAQRAVDFQAYVFLRGGGLVKLGDALDDDLPTPRRTGAATPRDCAASRR